jgi:hypothetical protein
MPRCTLVVFFRFLIVQVLKYWMIFQHSRLRLCSTPRMRMRAGRWQCWHGPYGGWRIRGAPRVDLVYCANRDERHATTVPVPQGRGAWMASWGTEEGLVVACPWCFRCRPPPWPEVVAGHIPTPDLLLPASATTPSCCFPPNLHLPVSSLSASSMYSFIIWFRSTMLVECVSSSKVMHKSLVPSSHAVLGVSVWSRFTNILDC